jgi:Trk-type K+ transport system membrane component
MNSNSYLWLKRGLAFAGLIAFDVYAFLPSSDSSERSSFVWLIVFGAVAGYLIYRLIDHKNDSGQQDEDLNRALHWVAIIAGALFFVLSAVLSFTSWGNTIGMIAILVVIDLVAVYYILTRIN